MKNIWDIKHEMKKRVEDNWESFLLDNDTSILSLPSEREALYHDFLKECIIEQAVKIAQLEDQIEDISNRLGCCC